jgi:hypothetical protein
MMPKVSPKSVVEERPEHALRQRVAHVADVLAHLVPDVGNLVRRRRLLQVDEDRRLPGDGVAAQAVEVVGLLQRALEPLGNLLDRLVHHRTGPAGRDDHRARGDRRVLAAPQLEEGHDAGHHGQDHQQDNQRALLERPFRQVRSNHERASGTRTF